MADETGAAVLAIFDQLINRIKQIRPVRSDGKPLGNGVVYSMMTLGMPVDPEDYLKPWSAIAGAVAQGADSAPAAPAASASGSAAAPQAAPDPKMQRALAAAYKTAVLCNTMLQVTTDGSYTPYPTGRSLAFAYEGVISAMQPLPMPPTSPAVQKQIDDAQKVLYEFDPDDGSITGKSKLYKKYQKNASAYALAKANYAVAMADAQKDPAKAAVWPMTSATYQDAVDSAYDDLTTGGADKIETALDILGSVGFCLQDRMIKKARQTFDVYNLGLAGVPSNIPYSIIEPSGWCDPDDDDEGWQQLSIATSDVQQYTSSNARSQGQFSWLQKASSTGGGGAVSFGFAAVGGSGGTSSSSSQHQSSSQGQTTNTFSNTARGVSISLEYMLATVARPWLVSDLFYMRNWYVPGLPKNAISDGTVENQANITDLAKLPLLPMIPQQMLLIRNVVITADDWGSDGQILNSYFGGDQGSSDSSASREAGSGGICLGFVNFGGSASHSESKAEGQGSNWQAKSATSHFGTTFAKNQLKIPGAQIIAFLSDIVPACAPIDDPGLVKPDEKKKSSVSADTLKAANF